MSPSEYQELTSFFVEQLGRHQQDTRAVIAASQQETKSFVGVIVDSLRHEIRLVADGVLTNTRAIEEHSRRLYEHGRRLEENSARIEENGARIEANGARIEANGARIEANGARIDTLTQRVERLEITVSTRFDDHEERLRALESPRR